MLENPYKNMSNDELCEIIKDYQQSVNDGKRVESFVPHARKIFENLNLDVDHYTIPLSDCIDMTKRDFFEELMSRFLNSCQLEIPKMVITKEWDPDKCPNCNYVLSESLGDGYYSHPDFLERCPKCNQCLKWKSLNIN